MLQLSKFNDTIKIAKYKDILIFVNKNDAIKLSK